MKIYSDTLWLEQCYREEAMGQIKGICISEKRGTQKKEIQEAVLIPDWGIEGDAHAGNWHRQVSLLSYEKIEDFRKRGADIDFGAFGENIIADGFDFRRLPVGTRFRCGEALLEMTQIGKECHSHCEIYKKMGDCIMPREGVFAKVLEGGVIKTGDELLLEERKEKRPFQAAVITLSDKGARGQREDKSGPLVCRLLKEAGYEVMEELLLADERVPLKKALERIADMRQADLIITTGGTGFSPRDITPETVMEAAERNAPGIAEAIRAYSMTITKRAMLSRGVSVIRGRTLIVTLPGSPKAVEESLSYILPELSHGISILREEIQECGRK